jgi:myosin heavy subunit
MDIIRVRRTPVVIDDAHNTFSIYRMHERKTEMLKYRAANVGSMKTTLAKLEAELQSLKVQLDENMLAMRQHGKDVRAAQKADKDAKRKTKKKRKRKDQDKEEPAELAVKVEAEPEAEAVATAPKKSSGIDKLTNERHALFKRHDALEKQVCKMAADIKHIESGDEQNDYVTQSYKLLDAYCIERAKLNEYTRLEEKGELCKYSEVQRRWDKAEYAARLRDITEEFVKKFMPDEVQHGADVMPENRRSATGDSNWSYDQIRSCVSAVRVYTYKRLNHFREYIRQRQGKSHVFVPEQVWTDIKAELRKFFCPPEQYRARLTFQLMAQVLKRLGLAKYFEHTRYLTKRLNPNAPVLDMPSARECRLYQRFTELEVPFEKFKKAVVATRKNFLSYPVVSYKLCELEGWHEYLPHFKLLKSRELLALQDAWWELAMNDLGWPFIRTVGRMDMSAIATDDDDS